MSRRFRTALAGALLLMLAPATVLAQDPLSVITPYPAITADPGGTARFELAISTETPSRVDLAIVEAPPDWTPRLRGGGTTVSAVFSDGLQPAEATLEVEVPADTAPGDYEVVLQATGAGTSVTVPMSVTIEAVEPGAVTMTTQYPTRVGSADTTFRFELELRNGTNQEQTFSLEAVGPAGWDVSAQPAGEAQAAAAVVAAGQTARINVTAEPPAQAEAGRYLVEVRALGGSEPVVAQLGVEVTGNFGMQLTTQDQRLNARVTAGSPTTVTLVVRNTGTAPLENINLSADEPRDWEASFEPASIPLLEAGAQRDVTLTITAAANAIAGDYLVTVDASSGTTSAGSLELRTTVETSPLWGIVGLLLVGAVGLGLLLVFRRYGRR